MKFNSRRPYLIRAIYDWAVDNQHTPHVLVAADYPGVIVPTAYVRDQRITLNISPEALGSFDFLQDRMWFSARFDGRPFEIEVPYGSVLAIFARENGEGVVFGEIEPPPDQAEPPPDDTPSSPDSRPRPARSHLRVVK